MARMIDADVASKRLRGWLEGPHEASEYNSGFDDAIYRVLDVIDHMPTLTQPNEPLTCKELKEMAGKPVYVVDPKKSISSWMLIDMVDEKSIWCAMAIGSTYRGFHKTYSKTWIAYRRPPEEEI